MASFGDWVSGARPRTLVAGAAPVFVGSMAAGTGTITKFLLCMVVALGLQIGVNYLNDAADASRGIDANRKGPTRLVASGAASGRAVLAAATVSVVFAGMAGVALAFMVGPEILVLGFVLLLAMFGYSAGPRPYASLGLGEFFVFATFGLAATVGTAYVQSGKIVEAAWWAAVPIGLASVALMLANNIRDIESDAASEKKTLCVRLGHARSVKLFREVLVLIFLSIGLGVIVKGLPTPAAFSLLAVPLAAAPWSGIASDKTADLIRVLKQTSILQAQLALGLVVGFIF